MAPRGIGIKVFPDLDMAALAAVITQMKAALGKAGPDISRSFDSQRAAIHSLENEMINSANRAAAAEINASKRAADAIIANKRAIAAESVAEDKRTLAQQRALLMAPIADKRSAQAQKDADEARARATKSAAEHEKAMSGATAGTLALGSAIKGVGVASMAGFGFAMDETTKMAGNFQAQLTKLTASAGESIGNISQVSNGILQLAPQVGYSVNKLGDAMYWVSKAGYKGAEGVTVLTSAAQGAKSENSELGEVLNGLTTSMNDFGYGADKSADVMSKMVTATGLSKASFQQFSGALHSAEPIAANIGKSQGLDQQQMQHLMSDVYGVGSQMTQSGMSADQSFQLMGHAYQKMLNPTNQMRDMMGALGIDSQDLSSHLGERGLAGTLQILDQAIQQHTKDGRVNLDVHYQSAQAARAEAQAFNALPGPAKAVAQAIKNNTLSYAEFRKSRGGLSVQMANDVDQWAALNNKLTGFSSAIKSGIGNQMDFDQALKLAVGDQETFQVAVQTTGENTLKTNDAIQKIDGTYRESDGTVKGFRETQLTLNAKMADAKAAFGAVATEVGYTFIPLMTGAANIAKDVGDELAKHPAIAEAVVLGLGGIGAAWGVIKAMSIAKTLAGITSSMWALTTAEGAAGVAARGLTAALGAIALPATLAALVPALGGDAPGATKDTANDKQIAGNKYFQEHKKMPPGYQQWLQGHGPMPPELLPYFKPGEKPGAQKPPAYFNDPWWGHPSETPIPGPVSNSEPLSGGGGGIAPHDPLAAGLRDKPSGHRNDPLYIMPAETTGSANNPLQDIVSKFGSQGFGLPALAGLMTTFLAQLAMDNPLGKLQTGQASSYAWWANPQKQIGNSQSNPMYVMDVSQGAQNAINLAQNANGEPYQWGGVGPNVYDCSGFMSDLFASATGRPTGQRYFTTTSDFPALGFKRGYLPGSPLNIGVSPDHMAGTLSNGVNVEAGGSGGFVQYGGNAAGALSPQFTERYHLPLGRGFAPSGFGMQHLPGPAGSPMQTSQSFTGGNKGGGGLSIQGGPLGTAEGAAAMAANAFAPGAGAAVSLAAQEANRFAAYLGQAAATSAEGVLETFSLSGTDLSGRNVDMSKSLIGKVITGISGARPNVPNEAGGPMDKNSPAKKAQGATSNTHNGDVNNTGVHIDSMNVESGTDNEAAARNLQQQMQSVGGQWINRGAFP